MTQREEQEEEEVEQGEKTRWRAERGKQVEKKQKIGVADGATVTTQEGRNLGPVLQVILGVKEERADGETDWINEEWKGRRTEEKSQNRRKRRKKFSERALQVSLSLSELTRP